MSLSWMFGKNLAEIYIIIYIYIDFVSSINTRYTRLPTLVIIKKRGMGRFNLTLAPSLIHPMAPTSKRVLPAVTCACQVDLDGSLPAMISAMEVSDTWEDVKLAECVQYLARSNYLRVPESFQSCFETFISKFEK